ncbi:MAG: HAD-IIB family hydrolase [Eubacteriales bacterium]
MAKIKLAALDVDGTLVRSDLSLAASVARAVESLRDESIEVAIVTGRCLGELIHFRQQFPWIRYFVVSNGATGYDALENRVFFRQHLPLAVAREIEREACRYDLLTQVYADGTSYLSRDCWRQINLYTAEHMHHPSLVAGYTPVDHVGELLNARKTDVEKLYFSFKDLSDMPRLHSICERFDVDLVVSIQNGLEVTQKGVDKGSGLVALCKHLGIPRSQTATVGDSMADVAMFRESGLSIAMENADEQVRQNADYVAPHNDMDGAVWAATRILTAR